MKKFTNNENASGALFALTATFLFCGLAYIVIGYGIDEVIRSFIASGGMPVSQMRHDTVNTLLLILQFEPFIMLIGMGIATWVSALKKQSGDVPVGKLIAAAGETILASLIVIALTAFGGEAIEFVINALDGLALPGSQSPVLYAVTQYIAPLFYGMMVLALVGAVIQFLLVCVQDVDVGVGL